MAKCGDAFTPRLSPKLLSLLKPWGLWILFISVSFLGPSLVVPHWLIDRLHGSSLLWDEKASLGSLLHSVRISTVFFAFCWFLFLVSCRATKGDCLTPGLLLAVEHESATSRAKATVTTTGAGAAATTASSTTTTPLLMSAPSANYGFTVPETNYLAFLWGGFRLFLILTVVSAVVVGIWWGGLPLVGIRAIVNTRPSSFPQLRHALVSNSVFPVALGHAQCYDGVSIGLVTVERQETNADHTLCMLGKGWPMMCQANQSFCDTSSIGLLSHASTVSECGALAEARDALVLGYRETTKSCCVFRRKNDNYNAIFNDPSEIRQNDTRWDAHDFLVCTGQVDGWITWVIFWLTVTNGIVVIVFVAVENPSITDQLTDWETRTVWCSQIPTRDADDGEKFELDDSLLESVGGFIQEAVEDKIHNILADAYRDHPRLPDLLQQPKVSQIHIARTELQAASGNEPVKYGLSGHAFVVASRREYAELLLRRTSVCGLLPWYFRWRDQSLLKMGVPPMASVTLWCQRSPPYADIVWENLHVRNRWIAQHVLTVFLFFLMLVLVAPTEMAESLTERIQKMRHQIDPLDEHREMWATFDGPHGILEQLPSYWLTLTNFVLLPLFIYYIGCVGKPFLRSKLEKIQFVQNYWFLLMFSICVPLLGLAAGNRSVLDAARQLHVTVSTNSLAELGKRASRLNGTLFVKYLLNAVFVTGGTQLILVGQTFVRWFCCCCPCCPGWEPPDFPWGYWYAWALSIMTMCLVLSVILPCMLPLGAIFFLMRYYVDRVNISRGAFSWSMPMDPSFRYSVRTYCVEAVALFWFCMAASFFAQGSAADDHFLRIPSLQMLCTTQSTEKSCPRWRQDEIRVPGTDITIPPINIPRIWVHLATPFCFFAVSLLGMIPSNKFASYLLPASIRRRQSTVAFILRLAFGAAALASLVDFVFQFPRIVWTEIPSQRYCAWILLWMAVACHFMATLCRFLLHRFVRGARPARLDDEFMNRLMDAPIVDDEALEDHCVTVYQHVYKKRLAGDSLYPRLDSESLLSSRDQSTLPTQILATPPSGSKDEVATDTELAPSSAHTGT
eukprot:TRINITY_DN3210_c0_g2_i1.p1 TRINITY_DN3210_c0_g2~~TRINITY_DN3210_c0_g2_i1.p1  ORF type:complete len:1087 (-),score=33.29 TRINITY_DN3210_c0_g2_i1:83-3301(-)